MMLGEASKLTRATPLIPPTFFVFFIMARIINELSFFRSEYLSLAQITNKHLNKVIKELFFVVFQEEEEVQEVKARGEGAGGFIFR
jgi:hypothetical protein